MKHKLVRITTVPISLDILLKGQLKFLNQEFEVIGVSGPGLALNTVKNRENVNLHSIDMHRNISPLNDLISLIRLFFYFVKVKPSIVHSITPKAGLLSMVAACLAKVPVRMHTFTGLIFPSKKGFLQKLLIQMDKLLCSCATNVYPEGEGVKRDLIRYNITNKPLNVIGNGNVNGIDTSYFSKDAIAVDAQVKIKSEYQIGDNDFIFIFIGRLVKDKGIGELIAAFEKLNKKYPQAKLILVGNEEPELDPLDKKTRTTMQNHPAIHLTGFQSDVRPFLAVSQALVFPSYREGFPNAPMQAGAMGLPSIVTDINGCNEIVQDGFNGLLIPAKDEEALLKAMIRLMEDKQLYGELSSNARESITSRYEQQALWELIKEEYSEQLKKAGVL